jgi:hypothetical protein
MGSILERFDGMRFKGGGVCEGENDCVRQEHSYHSLISALSGWCLQEEGFGVFKKDSQALLRLSKGRRRKMGFTESGPRISRSW